MESLLVPSQATTELPGSRILVLAPHPDDEVFGCGGAILCHVDSGKQVTVVIFSDGTHGVPEALIDSTRRTRRSESAAAGAILGYGTPRFLAYPDRGLQYGEKLIAEIQALCADTGADLVYTPSVSEMHPDHRMLALATVEALRRTGGDVLLAQYEVGMPLRPNCLLDVSAQMARKEAAMACFVSQNSRQRYDLHIAALNRYRTYTLPGSVTAAEAFVLLSATALAADPLGPFRSETARQRALGLPVAGTDIPLVSVIIRSMDRPSLQTALDSVALQTYGNIEVVLVNAGGGRHRDCGQWCGRFPLRVVEAGKPLGRSAAANAGLDAARGELLIFLDDDDRFLPHHIAALKDCLAGADPDVIAAYAAVSCVDKDGREIRRYERDYDPMWLRIENFIPIHALLFRRLPATQALRFDESLDYCEDWDFWLRLQDHGSFRFVPGTGAIYNFGTGAGSGIWNNEPLARTTVLALYKKHMQHWDDSILWQLFELAHYKPLYAGALGTIAEQKDAALNTAAAHQAELEVFAARLQVQQNIITDLEQAVAERDQRIATLLASTSWRITRPLRRLARLLRGSDDAGSS